MYMYNLICITNRHLCSNNFLEQIEKICRAYSTKGILGQAEAGQNPESISENVVKAENRQFPKCSKEQEGQASQISGCRQGKCNCSEQNTVQAARVNLKIVLREKDLQEKDYEQLAKQVLDICSKYNIECILHTYYGAAEKLNCKKIHLPLDILRKNPEIAEKFEVIGVSTHSKEDAMEAEKLGAYYITAGHIFETDCKKGLPGRGLKFLKNVCESVDIPVYAIGGISSANINEVIEAGAYGACLMSGFMKAEKVEELFK